MSFKDLGEEAEAVGEIAAEEIEIVPMDLELHKPLNFEEAIEALSAEKKDNLSYLTIMTAICESCIREPMEDSDSINHSSSGFSA